MPVYGFSFNNYSPQFKNLKFTNPPSKPPITLGDGSYIVSCYYESGGEDEHVLIGKYTSIAMNSKMLLGLNHDYISATTYPFRVFFKGLKNLPPPPKKYSNMF